MSTNIFTRLLPSYICGSSYPSITQLDPSLHLSANRDMSDDPGVQILDVRPKRTSQMSQESGDRTHRSWHRHFHPLNPQENPHNRLAPMLRRPPQSPQLPLPTQMNPSSIRHTFRLNGQTPTPNFTRRQENYETEEDSGIEQGNMNGQSEVIDLTGDEPEEPPQRARSSVPNTRISQLPRPFRYVNGPVLTNEIVDLVDDEPDDPAEAADGPPSSPEVQFVSSSRRAPPPPRDLFRDGRAFLRDYSDARALELLDNRSPAVPFEPPLNTALQPVQRHLLDRISRLRARNASRNGEWDSEDDGFESEGYGSRTLETWRRRRGLVNLTIDYGLAAFPIGSTPVATNQESARPTYKPPSPAPEGFTRTLTDEDVAICPNCACELGVGEGKKQEIWVAKPCGHVYCGECAENRSKSKAKKTNGAQKTKPFAKCQVPDCGKQISSPTAMFHLYL